MFRRILVATDLTDASKPALDAAFELATRLGAVLCVLHVSDPPFAPPSWYRDRSTLSASDSEAERHSAEHVLDAYRRERGGDLQVEVQVTSGAPSDVVVDTARSWQADLVVVGSHGRRGVRDLILGSVADKVLRAAPCPVLTVRAS